MKNWQKASKNYSENFRKNSKILLDKELQDEKNRAS